jgi:phosphoglycerol transferase
MGGIVASQCGIPLFTPSHANSMSGMDSFLPAAIGLGDLLHEEGYFLSFMEGAYMSFAGKGKFLRTHHFDETLGFAELYSRISDQSYINNWGLFDDSVFDLAFDHYTELSGRQQKFGLFVLTLDTHHPEGHRSRSMASVGYSDGTNPILNAVAASDALIARFVRRIQASPYGKKTVIVIASDHTALENTATDQLNRRSRRNMLIVLDPRRPEGHRYERAGSTLDTGVTLLSFLGYKGQIGLGRDLLDPAISDAEIAHIEDSSTLQSWRGEISKFWEFPHLRESISFTDDPPVITIDGRNFKAPVLIELGENYRTMLRFEFDATWDVRLADQVQRLPSDEPYLLIAKNADAKMLLAEPIEATWVLVLGKAGGGRMAMPFDQGAKLSRKEIDRYLAALPPHER